MVIALVEIEKIENEYPELVTKSPFQLWKEYNSRFARKKIAKKFYFMQDVIKIILKFDIAIGELLRFLGIILLSD